MRDSLIRCEGVGKKFCKSLRRSLWYGLTDTAWELSGLRASADALVARGQTLRPQEFWANQDISFEVGRGECLGLIGRNGSGKTTLLKMLNGLVKPDSGRIEVRGCVAGLIALGAGFNGILTGRENVFVNGAILGMSRKQIAESLDEIVDFAELGEFIDTPVQNYSSGMQVRLGFAIAAVLIRPDILLLDEVLAVGDIGFTMKCLNAVRRISKDCAVVFVSHSMQFISAFCSRVLVLKHGRTICDSRNVGDGIAAYLSQFPMDQTITRCGGSVINSITLHCPTTGVRATHGVEVPQADELRVELDVVCDTTARPWVQVDSISHEPILAARLAGDQGEWLTLPIGSHRLSFSLGKLDFNGGLYSLVVGLIDAEKQTSLCRHQGAASFRIVAETIDWGHVVRIPHTTVLTAAT